ncbi:ATP-binding protein [Streptomyces sp. NPDC087851]|uniref:ATP-binding protein n=1 Tax=Streptomyces sp. NPDC087851 TaxID=3365810 RepID=UPI0037FB85B5
MSSKCRVPDREFGLLAGSMGAAMGEPHEVSFRLTRRRSSVPRARATLRAVLGSWGVDQDVAEAGELILSELVTNALRVRVPGDRHVGVRIVRSPVDEVVRLEVSDAGSGRPEVRAPRDNEAGGRGLLLVEAVAERWGVEGRPGGIGKTVWAELKAADTRGVPDGTEVSALAVRPGHVVRVWGAWHTVRGVRGEPGVAGRPDVLLALDDGPELRIPADEPVTVWEERDGGPD